MAYRNGTYVAFAADGNTDITTSDIRFYNLLKGWNLMQNRTFRFINSHERGPRIRSYSQEQTIKRTLRERLDNSKRFMLLVGNTTRFDTDFVPYEIKYAIDTCKLPVIVCYVNHKTRLTANFPVELESLLPQVLVDRINNNTARTIHIPFREVIMNYTISQYDFKNLPEHNFTVFTDDTYKNLYPFGGI